MRSSTYFVVSIDTECDKDKDWGMPYPSTFRSVLEGIPKVLQPIFNTYGVKPTYLLSPEVIESDKCVEVLSNLCGTYELGTHLHGEFIEPLRKDCPSRTDELQCFYSSRTEERKLSNLTKLFKEKFGYRPLSFRAGCFGISGRTIGFLESLGYLVDSSVTPHVGWSHNGKIIDFRTCPQDPYFPSYDDVCQQGTAKLLEVPVSINQRLFDKSYLKYLGPLNFGKIRKLAKKIAGEIWLRPSYSTAREMIGLIKKRIMKGNNPTILNMMFHSVEIIPAASPYTQTEKEVKKFLKRMVAVFEYLQNEEIEYITLSEVYNLSGQYFVVSRSI